MDTIWYVKRSELQYTNILPHCSDSVCSLLDRMCCVQNVENWHIQPCGTCQTSSTGYHTVSLYSYNNHNYHHRLPEYPYKHHHRMSCHLVHCSQYYTDSLVLWLSIRQNRRLSTWSWSSDRQWWFNDVWSRHCRLSLGLLSTSSATCDCTFAVRWCRKDGIVQWRVKLLSAAGSKKVLAISKWRMVSNVRISLINVSTKKTSLETTTTWTMTGFSVLSAKFP